jgi:hypothetical protein
MRRPPVPGQLQYDPCRRLLAAILLQAVLDAFFPNQSVPARAQASARLFLADWQVKGWFEELGIPWERVQRRVLAETFNQTTGL